MNHLILAADYRGVGLEYYAASHTISHKYEIQPLIMHGGQIETIHAAINKKNNQIKGKNDQTE